MLEHPLKQTEVKDFAVEFNRLQGLGNFFTKPSIVVVVLDMANMDLTSWAKVELVGRISPEKIKIVINSPLWKQFLDDGFEAKLVAVMKMHDQKNEVRFQIVCRLRKVREDERVLFGCTLLSPSPPQEKVAYLMNENLTDAWKKLEAWSPDSPLAVVQIFAQDGVKFKDVDVNVFYCKSFLRITILVPAPSALRHADPRL